MKINKYVVKFQEGVTVIINANNKMEAINKLFKHYEILCDMQDFSITTVLDEIL